MNQILATPAAPPPPRVEPLGANRYRLSEDYVYEWQLDGRPPRRLVVPAGFVCDLTSVPRLLWWYISPFDLGAAAVPDDRIYAHGGRLPAGSDLVWREGEWVDHGRPWTRAEADRLFARIMREGGVSKTKRRRAWRAVRLFGWRARKITPLR